MDCQFYYSLHFSCWPCIYSLDLDLTKWASLVAQLVKNPTAMQGMLPGWGRPPGEGIGYPLQYSWVSLVAQMVRICLHCGRPGFNPWVGRSPGGGHGNPLQCSWASLVAQNVQNPPAMQETWVWSLGWKIPWRRAWKATPVFLLRESSWTEESG